MVYIPTMTSVPDTPDAAYMFVYQEWEVMKERVIPSEERLEKTMPVVTRSAAFSVRLQEARIAQRITVADLAEKVGCTSRSMAFYENGTEMPPPAIHKNICQVLKMQDD